MAPQTRHSEERASYEVPLSIQIESTFHQWISLLRDYGRASGEWKNTLKEELWDVYCQMNSFKDVEGVTNNAYFTIITSNTFDQHLILAQPKGYVIS